MNKILTGLMAFTCILTFSLEATAQRAKGKGKGKTTRELKKLETARSNTQNASKSMVSQRAEAVEMAVKIRRADNNNLIYNLERIITTNPKLRNTEKVSTPKVLGMIRSLNKVNEADLALNPAKVLAKLKEDLVAEGISRKQIEELSKEICKI